MAAIGAGPPSLLARLKSLAIEPQASHWARLCAWVPGTGYCRNRDCSETCLFRAQREAEAARLQRWRRLRRIFG
jgi:hypothetical protein